MARIILIVVLTTSLTACTGFAVKDDQSKQTINPVLVVDEAAISGQGIASFVFGDVAFSQHPDDGSFAVVRVGSSIGEKATSSIASEAAITITVGESEVLEFSPAPEPRSVMFRLRSVHRNLQPSANSPAT